MITIIQSGNFYFIYKRELDLLYYFCFKHYNYSQNINEVYQICKYGKPDKNRCLNIKNIRMKYINKIEYFENAEDFKNQYIEMFI